MTDQKITILFKDGRSGKIIPFEIKEKFLQGKLRTLQILNKKLNSFFSVRFRTDGLQPPLGL